MRFITVALAFFLPGILSGQFVTRTQTTDSVSVRAEGIAELVVDLVQQCTQSRPGAISTPYLTAHIQAFFNTFVSNSVVSPPARPGALVDAILAINENSGSPAAGSTLWHSEDCASRPISTPFPHRYKRAHVATSADTEPRCVPFAGTRTPGYSSQRIGRGRGPRMT